MRRNSYSAVAPSGVRMTTIPPHRQEARRGDSPDVSPSMRGRPAKGSSEGEQMAGEDQASQHYMNARLSPESMSSTHLLNVCIESETRFAGAMSRVSRRGAMSAVVLLSSSAPQHCTAHFGPGVSSMSAPLTPTPPADAPFGTCPRCWAIGPPHVTLVTITLLYFRCTQCGFEWPVRSTYMSRIPPREGH